MDAREFLRLATILAHGVSEVEWRSAVSRAYYAAFHVAREFFERCGFSVPRQDRAHAYLWLRLIQGVDTSVQKAGSDLNTLRGDRNRADYDLARPFLQPLAANRVQVAARIIQSLAAAENGPTKPQIIEAMKTYERDVLKEVTWQP